MKFECVSFTDGGVIPDRYAFCKPDPASKITLSENFNPGFRWSELPAGTKTLALICHDSDVPTDPCLVNQEGKTIPASLPRADFFHWALIEMPTNRTRLEEGDLSRQVVTGGKSDSYTNQGARQGINDYTGWFAGDDAMKGDYHGYDGPCPPWNDELVHHYHFTLYALDVSELSVDDRFTGPEALAAMEGHVLASARITGTYTLNPKLRAG
jgi:Raf kinase inhibitor-like YbhB/YbcL family protein